ncbi:peptide ABC transporter substrate-binding protein [Moraxella marmotae]|uniref:peptide ABC transporter substrate-binding protein n=1 Tax=Moraxella marmotae TaxID=3344520 RepID=UPI0035F2619A
MKKFTPTQSLLAAAVIAGAFALSGCGDDTGSGEPLKTASKTHFNFAQPTEPESLDPQRASETLSFDIIRQMFIGLVGSDKDGKTVPTGAESWSDEGGKIWTFKIRQGMTWSNGDPITAHDFVYTMRRLTDPKNDSPYGAYLVDAKVANAKAISEGKADLETLGVKALDDYTLQITLTESVPYLVDVLALPVTYAVHQKTVETYGDKWTDPANIVVSGAYKLKEKVVNSHTALERNPNYYDNANTKIDSFNFVIVSGGDTNINRYKAGEIDIAALPAERFEQMKAERPDEVQSYPKQCVFYYEFNTQKAPFTDQRVRQAVSMLIDREVMTEQILGRGEVPVYQLTPTNVQGMKEIKPAWAALDRPARIEAAKKLLAEAGYNESKPLKFDLLYSTSDIGKKFTTATVAMLKESGVVDATALNQEWKISLDTRRKGKYQSALAGWCSDYNEPSSFYNLFRTGGGNNSAFYANPAYDALLDQALDGDISTEARLDKYYEAERLLQQDVPAAFIYQPVSSGLVKSNLKAVSLKDPASNWLIKDWYIE